MPRSINLGIGTSDYNRLRRATRNFNQQRRRAIAREPAAAAYLPAAQSLRELRKNVTTRTELNFEIKSMKNLTKPGSMTQIKGEGGQVVTKWEMDYYQAKVEKINQQRAKEREQGRISPDRGTMHSIKDNNLAPKTMDIDKIRPGKGWELFKRSVNNQARDNYYQEKAEIYKRNYLRSIKANLGKDGKKLYEMVSKIPAKVIYESFYDDPVLQIGFTSPPLNSKDISEEALEHWQDQAEDILEGMEEE